MATSIDLSLRALDGTTVLEFADYVTGPYCGALLADMGARVIKIEAPGHGDPFRGWGEDLYSPSFCAVNRGKESIALDLRHQEAREVLYIMIRQADVFVQNHRPGAADRLGLAYERLAQVNPALVYCSISGFGGEGPYRDRPGYDTIGQAMGGLLSVLTDPENPRGMGVSLSDHLTGVFACYGILCALLARVKTGRGQHVETSLLQATVAFLGENAARYFANGEVPDRKHRTALAQVYAFVAGDGLPFVIHLSSPQKFFRALAETIERPQLVEDARFHDRAARVQHYDQLAELLAAVFRGQPRAVWLERLLAHDVPCAPLNNLKEVFEDPQVQQLGLATSAEHPVHGTVRLAGSPVRLSDTPPGVRSAPPALGEHTAALAREFGFEAQLERLWRLGAI